MNHKILPRNNNDSERGAALVVTVLVLVCLTMIGLASVSSSNLLVNAAGNVKCRSTAYYAAESCMYYQIRRIHDGGSTTTALTNYSLGNGTSCSATAPAQLANGTGSGGGVNLLGYSMENGTPTVAYYTWEFQVNSNGLCSTSENLDVIVRLPQFST